MHCVQASSWHVAYAENPAERPVPQRRPQDISPSVSPGSSRHQCECYMLQNANVIYATRVSAQNFRISEYQNFRIYGCLHLQRFNIMDYTRTVPIPGVAMDEWYSDGLGCVQGVILSPLMFDIEFNDVLPCVQQVRHPGAGVDIANGRRIFGQLFADDGLLFVETEEGLQAMISALVAHCTESVHGARRYPDV